MCLICWERKYKSDPHSLFRGDLGGCRVTQSLVSCFSPAPKVLKNEILLTVMILRGEMIKPNKKMVDSQVVSRKQGTFLNSGCFFLAKQREFSLAS